MQCLEKNNQPQKLDVTCLCECLVGLCLGLYPVLLCDSSRFYCKSLEQECFTTIKRILIIYVLILLLPQNLILAVLKRWHEKTHIQFCDFLYLLLINLQKAFTKSLYLQYLEIVFKKEVEVRHKQLRFGSNSISKICQVLHIMTHAPSLPVLTTNQNLFHSGAESNSESEDEKVSRRE